MLTTALTALPTPHSTEVAPSVGNTDSTLEKIAANCLTILNACVCRSETYPQNIATFVAKKLTFATDVILACAGTNLSKAAISEILIMANKALSAVICVTSRVAGEDVLRLSPEQIQKMVVAMAGAVASMRSKALQLVTTPQDAKPFLTVHLGELSSLKGQVVSLPLLHGSPLTYLGKDRNATLLRLCQSEANLIESEPSSLDHHIKVGFKLNTYTCLESQPAIVSNIQSYLGISSFTLFAAKGGVGQHQISLFRSLPPAPSLHSQVFPFLHGLSNLMLVEKNTMILAIWQFPTFMVASVQRDNETWMMYANAGDPFISEFPGTWSLDEKGDSVVVPREDYSFLPVQHVATSSAEKRVITPPTPPVKNEDLFKGICKLSGPGSDTTWGGTYVIPSSEWATFKW